MKKITFIIFAVLLLTLANPVFAQQTGGSTQQGQTGGSTPVPGSEKLPTLSNPLRVNNITDTLLTIADLLIFIGVIIAIIMFIFIGFKFVMAQGSDTKLAEAKEWFLYAAIGTAVLISSKVIVQVVQNTLTSAGIVDEKIFTNSNNKI